MKIHFPKYTIDLSQSEKGIQYPLIEMLRKKMAYHLIIAEEDWEINFWKFIEQWTDDEASISMQTSGSTGFPKTIIHSKNAMVKSAQRTISHFNLQKDMNALLCMDCKFIGAKMMVVRALECEMNLYLVKPNANPFIEFQKHYNNKIDFAAMVPLQLHEESMEGCQHMNFVDKLILGGSALPEKLSIFLQQNNTSTQIFETYGMTETISHIALKKIEESHFTTLPGIKIETDDRSCLVLIDQLIDPNNTIVTNDIVQISNNIEFKILGRWDNIINSGGIKLIPESIEEKISALIEGNFMIGAIKDEKFGEKLVLLIEDEIDQILLLDQMKSLLSSIELPKAIYQLDQLMYTDNFKIDRKKSIQKLMGEISKN